MTALEELGLTKDKFFDSSIESKLLNPPNTNHPLASSFGSFMKAGAQALIDENSDLIYRLLNVRRK